MLSSMLASVPPTALVTAMVAGGKVQVGTSF
jgi:hypothetical protein